MKRRGLAVLLSALLPFCGGCFSARPSAEGYHDRILTNMDRDQVHSALGVPQDAHPIPGQGAAAELPVEQWRYQWNYPTGKTLTILVTLGFGLIWMDMAPYGFDVGFGRDGKVRIVSDVGPRRR